MRFAITSYAMVTALGASAFAQSLAVTTGSLQVWDFADGFSFFDSSAAGLGTNSASVDTGSGFDTAVSVTISAAVGLAEFDVAGQAGGNGAWSMVISFDLADPSGMGWYVETAGNLSQVINLVSDSGSSTPGSFLLQDGKTIASAGSYVLTVNEPFWEDLFDRDGIMDSTWTGRQGDYSLILRAVPAPSAAAFATAFLFVAGMRRRTTM